MTRGKNFPKLYTDRFLLYLKSFSIFHEEFVTSVYIEMLFDGHQNSMWAFPKVVG